MEPIENDRFNVFERLEEIVAEYKEEPKNICHLLNGRTI